MERHVPAKAMTRDLKPLRVRKEPPTLEEAVFAAQGLTDDVDQQTDIVAGLMDLTPDEVRPRVAKEVAASQNRSTTTVETRARTTRTVVVEKARRFRVSIPPGTTVDLTRRAPAR
ncbi:hypothetical protein ABEG18_00920 [Alsobacter sp. KACC 23698]|uniref:Uncharacterized protein n=1 Tax=Alsobacter sp. KACC 23698 TaxID=3149229 RepID=A0AAU7JNX5_9HYPH